MKLFSIITINLNNAAGLKKTVESVVSQEFSDFEYIVIDGASTDGSVDVIKNFESKISFKLSEKDSGIYNAMNKALRHAHGIYCLFLNSGDILAGNNVLKNVSDTGLNADIVYGNMIIRHSDGKKQFGKMPERITFYQMIVDTLWHPVSFIKKSLFDKYGFYREDIRIVADYEFFLKTIMVHKASTQYIPITISEFDMNGMSSDPLNVELIKAERKKIQLQYFHETMLDLVNENKIMKNSFCYKLYRWFRL